MVENFFTTRTAHTWPSSVPSSTVMKQRQKFTTSPIGIWLGKKETYWDASHWCLQFMLSYHWRVLQGQQQGKYWRCLKCNLTTPVRFSTMFYKTKMKLVKLFMMLYCFTELNIRNTQKRNQSSLPHENQDNIFFYKNWSYYQKYKVNYKKKYHLAMKVIIVPAYSYLTSGNRKHLVTNQTKAISHALDFFQWVPCHSQKYFPICPCLFFFCPIISFYLFCYLCSLFMCFKNIYF